MTSFRSRCPAAPLSIFFLFVLVATTSACGYREIASEEDENTEGSAGAGGEAGSGEGGSGGAGEAGSGEGGTAGSGTGGSGTGGSGGMPPGGEAGTGGTNPPPPPTECTELECGPAPGMPNYPCPDGSMGGPVCRRLEDGTCGWVIRDCPPVNEDPCGECEEGEYCEVKNCGRRGEEGICLPKPEACYMIWAPVCGCDGETYGNDCEAHASGTAIDYEGECKEDPNVPPPPPPPPGEECYGWGEECRRGQFCQLVIGTCMMDMPYGTCQEPPEACIEIWDPVCGCDMKTYGNECMAHSEMVSVWYEGECKE